MMLNFQKRVAVITGGARGIGLPLQKLLCGREPRLHCWT